ncbi:MAG: hypothetical protein QG608_1953 [Actinomycetota bacterium]|nr:hypothetical protein [Actinomycetota bacterium]
MCTVLLVTSVVGALALHTASSLPLEAGTGLRTTAIADTAASARHLRKAGTARTTEDHRDQAVDTVLKTMTGALRTGNEKSFLSVVDPRVPALQTRQRSVFRTLHSLGADNLLLERRRGMSRSAGSSQPTGTTVVGVRMSYRLTSWDTQPVTADLAMAFTPGTGGSWLLRATTGDGTAWKMGTDQYLEPWLLGGLQIVRRGHVLLVGDADRSEDNADLADDLEDAALTVRKIWQEQTWNGKVVAFAVRDEKFLDAWFDGQVSTSEDTDPDAPATFDAQVQTISSDWGREIGMPRMAIAPYLLGQRDDGLRRLLRHEIAHVALFRTGWGPVPTWLEEGAAEFTGWGAEAGGGVAPTAALGQRGLPESQWKALRSRKWRPTLVADSGQFYAGSGEKVGTAYASAWLTCLYIADRYGPARLRALYRATATYPGDRSAAEAEQIALRSVLNTDRAGLRSQVGAFAYELRKGFD